MIPRRIFWSFDILVVSIAFVSAYFLVSGFAPLIAPDSPYHLSWLEVFGPLENWTGALPPFTDLLWIYGTMIFGVIFSSELIFGYGDVAKQSRTRLLLISVAAPLFGLSVLAMSMFALKIPAWSRLFVFSFTFLCMAYIWILRVAAKAYFTLNHQEGREARNVVVIGSPRAVEWIHQQFEREISPNDYRLLGYLGLQCEHLAVSPAAIEQERQAAVSLDILGVANQLGNLLVTLPIHEVIVVYPVTDGKWITDAIEKCDEMGVMLHLVPEVLLLHDHTALRRLYQKQPLYIPSITLVPFAWNTEALFVKRLFDMIVAATLLLLLLPLFVLIAIAIKLTTPSLSVMYLWRVVGQNGVEFTGYKFTTMVREADQIKPQLIQHNEMNGPVFKMKDDPRVTPLGKFLRKYSLNELPQLWSVLRGDMSLVGPRPAFRHELERYEFWHKRKLSIKPGITCLWQIRGRNKISNFDDWVKMDLEYIDNWSLWLDFKILLRTAWVVITGTGS